MNSIKVFVYGTLRKSLPNHYWLKKTNEHFAKFLYEGKTQTKFPLIIATKYNIPFLMNVPGTGNHISGEIYSINESMLHNLDILEEYPQLYDREIVKVNGSDGQTHDCWIYMIKKFPQEYLNYSFLKEYTNPTDQPYREECGSEVIDLDKESNEVITNVEDVTNKVA